MRGKKILLVDKKNTEKKKTREIKNDYWVQLVNEMELLFLIDER